MLEELAQAEKGQISVSDPGTSDEIPFGIRAIEQGYKVEGVWISKTNTPLQTPISSRRPSLQSLAVGNDNNTPQRVLPPNRDLPTNHLAHGGLPASTTGNTSLLGLGTDVGPSQTADTSPNSIEGQRWLSQIAADPNRPYHSHLAREGERNLDQYNRVGGGTCALHMLLTTLQLTFLVRHRHSVIPYPKSEL